MNTTTNTNYILIISNIQINKNTFNHKKITQNNFSPFHFISFEISQNNNIWKWMRRKTQNQIIHENLFTLIEDSSNFYECRSCDMKIKQKLVLVIDTSDHIKQFTSINGNTLNELSRNKTSSIKSHFPVLTSDNAVNIAQWIDSIVLIDLPFIFIENQILLKHITSNISIIRRTLLRYIDIIFLMIKWKRR